MGWAEQWSEKKAKFDNSVIDLWSVLFGGFEDGSLEKKKRHLDNQITCISSTGGAQQHVEVPLIATTVVAPLPPAAPVSQRGFAGFGTGCTILFQHLSTLRLPPIKTSVVSPLPPSASIKRCSLHSAPPIPLHWCGNQPSALCFFSTLWSYDPTAARRLTAEHSIPPPFIALLVNLCDLSVVIGVLHRRRWYQQQPIPVYFINTTWVVKKTNTNKNTRKKTLHVKYWEFA